MFGRFQRHRRSQESLREASQPTQPKPNFKSGVISESTTALNVDQTITNMDQKNNTPSGGAIPLPLAQPLAPSATATRGGNNQDQPSAAVPTVERGIGGSATTPASATTQKKEVGLAKVQADRKKIDARKKSLKRL
ncbi:ubiquitin-conjugating enzyme E2 22 [Citrus sinensis]|nr:ubiquitin-conjugating enzyme E2 22 [Citrus sinensis]